LFSWAKRSRLLLPGFLVALATGILMAAPAVAGPLDTISLVKDIYPGESAGTPNSGFPYDLTDVDGTLFFGAKDATHGYELWKSDGTAAGTTLVKDIGVPFNGDPGNLVDFNGAVFFAAGDAAHGYELWKSDGTTAGTTLVKDIYPGTDSGGGPNGGDPSELTVVNGTLFFSARDATHGQELWKSDGTTAGTKLVKDIDPGTNGTGPNDGSPAGLTAVGSTLFFSARDATRGKELWKSNGTTAGTTLVKDTYPGSNGGNPNNGNPGKLADIGGELFFRAADATHGEELWKSNGTTAGTTLVKDIYPDSNSGIPDNGNPYKLIDVNGVAFFEADDGTHGTELWKSDGTPGGTTLVKDINPGGDGSPFFYSSGDVSVNINGTLYFQANDGGSNYELWKSDGTPAGTTLAKEINTASGEGGTPGGLSNAHGRLFFTADDGTHGSELWAGTDTVAPETTITKAPKHKLKTKKRKAKVRIKFSSEPGASFGCTLDRKTEPCSSPFKTKVRKGKHVFSVVASDDVGNPDPTPASVKFKVVRKKHKKHHGHG
jgi:ELWxxDGT repeat protein